MFVFGTQYLRGETPERKDWDRDMAAMAGMGFNTLRAWLVWGTLEPVENKIDWDYIDTFADLVEKHGLRCGYLFHMHGAPEWAIRMYAHAWYVNSKGIAFEPAARPNTPTGGWPGLCPDHEDARALTYRFIRQVAEHLGARAETGFFEPMNEPHMWVDWEQQEIHCYCEATRKAFREWLQKRYGTWDKLSWYWGRRHSGWEDVRPPRWTRVGYMDWYDWRLFTMENIAAEIERRTQVIRGVTDKAVIAHAWGGGSLCANLPGMAFDDWRNAVPFDMWGYSAFPGSPKDAVILAMGTDATRAAAKGKTIWQSELGAGDRGSGTFRNGRIPPALEASFTWESVAHGAKGVLYWQYRKERHGTESGCPGMVDYDGSATAVSRAIEQVGRVVQVDANLFLQAQLPPAKVGILFSPRCYQIAWCDERNSIAPNDALSGYYRMFWEAGIPVEILHEEFTSSEELACLDLVVLPFAVGPDPGFLKKLKDYVHAGGAIWADPYFAAFDERMWLAECVPGAGYHKVFGCVEDDIYQAEPEGVTLVYNGQKALLKGSRFRETFREVTADVAASYADGSPAVLSSRYGKGQAVLSGLNLGLCYSPKAGVGDDIVRHETGLASPLAKQMVLDFVRERGIISPASTDVVGVTANLLLTPDDQPDLLIAINHLSTSQSVHIRTHEAYASARSLITHTETTFRDHRIAAELEPLSTGVWVIERG